MCITIPVGSTERAILANADRIVQESLPLKKVEAYYAEIPDSCRNVVLGFVTHHESTKLVGYGFIVLFLIIMK